MFLEAVVDLPADATAVVTLAGPLTLGTNLKIVDAQLQKILADGVRKLVLDLGACAYMDSAGLGVLVHTYGLVEQGGGAMRLCGVGPRIAALLQMTKTDGFLPSDADRVASLAALGQVAKG